MNGCMEKIGRNVRNILESLTSKRGARLMSSNRALVWTGRLAALVAAVVIPACGNSGSPGNPIGGIFWVTQGNTNAATGTQAGDFWNDPNDGQVGPIGISNIITSADDATYDGYYPSSTTGIGGSKITYILSNLHPLSTDTGSITITSKESQLQGQINAYRQTQLGNVGGGGVNGGVAVGNVTGIILAGHFRATKSARAHCKHYALFEAGFPPGQNQEGDLMQSTAAGTPAYTPGTPPFPTPIGFVGTNPALEGRLGKIGVVALDPVLFANNPAVIDGGSIVYSGGQYGEFGAVFQRLVIDVPNVIGALGWTHFAVGHWRGGPRFYYWNIIFLYNPIDL